MLVTEDPGKVTVVQAWFAGIRTSSPDLSQGKGRVLIATEGHFQPGVGREGGGVVNLGIV